MLLVVAGWRNRRIADKIGVSVKTVDTHCCRILNKLDLDNKVVLTRYAIRRGWVRP